MRQSASKRMKRFGILQLVNLLGDTEYTDRHGRTRIQFDFIHAHPSNPCSSVSYFLAVWRLFSEQVIIDCALYGINISCFLKSFFDRLYYSSRMRGRHSLKAFVLEGLPADGGHPKTSTSTFTSTPTSIKTTNQKMHLPFVGVGVDMLVDVDVNGLEVHRMERYFI
jgi:hypothetical protein